MEVQAFWMSFLGMLSRPHAWNRALLLKLQKGHTMRRNSRKVDVFKTMVQAPLLKSGEVYTCEVEACPNCDIATRIMMLK